MNPAVLSFRPCHLSLFAARQRTVTDCNLAQRSAFISVWSVVHESGAIGRAAAKTKQQKTLKNGNT